MVGRGLLIWLPLIRTLAAFTAVAILPTSHAAFTVLGIVVLVTQAALNARFVYGLDGSDQMQLVLWAGLTVFSVDPGGTVGAVGLYFIAAQALVAYFASGISKLFGAEWRAGTAVERVLRTTSHGSPWAHRLVRDLHLSPLLSWSTITFETLIPAALLSGNPTLAMFALASALSFHIGVALAMGLNTFFWAFVATYPALVFASSKLPW